MNLPHKGSTSYPKTIAVTSDIPDKNTLVTTNTTQTITGDKTFTTDINFTIDNAFHHVGTECAGLSINQPPSGGQCSAYLEAYKVGINFGDYDSTTKNGELSFKEFWKNDESSIINAVANIHVASTDQQTSSSVDIHLPTESGKLALTSENTFQTTAPTGAITDGGIHIVYLSSEPATKYDGYIYLIAE